MTPATTMATPHLLTALAFWASLFLLIPSSSYHASAFGTQQPAALAISPCSRTRTAKSKYVSAVCSISGGGSGDTSDDNETSPIFRQAALVGATTAAMAFFYGQILDTTVRSVWTKLPSLLAASGCPTLANLGGSSRYILCTMSLGGLLMGILSSILKPSYTVAEFVAALSGKKSDVSKLPALLPALPNLLILSLVTSTFGFSVGPEAPMVCAGGLIGLSMGKRWHNSDGDSDDATSKKKEILVYAGAAGALTAFMGIPLAGPIFALELTRASANLSRSAGDSLGPAVAASAAALFLIRGAFKGGSPMGGHFMYHASDAIGALSGRAAMATSLFCGLGGAVLGTCFHALVHALKDIFWVPSTPNKAQTEGTTTLINREVLVKTSIGVAVGVLSMLYPQSTFWGEGSLQCVIDGHKTPFSATKHGLSSALTGSALVDPSSPFQSASAAAQVGLAKLLSISLACAGKFPGGIIFPMFFASCPIAHSALMVLAPHLPPSIAPTAVMCLMAALQSSVTRTPLATVFMLALSASSTTALSTMLPSVILSSYIGVWASRFLSKDSYFDYK